MTLKVANEPKDGDAAVGVGGRKELRVVGEFDVRHHIPGEFERLVILAFQRNGVQNNDATIRERHSQPRA
jgi:hypothetical protein